jgi:enoyl-CoA hydratase/carnithine racemase
LGIVQYSVPADEVEAKARALADKLCAGSVSAAREIKACIRVAPSEAGFEAEVSATERLLADPRTRGMLQSFLTSSS